MDILNKINVETKILNIMELKLLGIYSMELNSMMIMKITIYIQQTINNTSYFLVRHYHHLINT